MNFLPLTPVRQAFAVGLQRFPLVILAGIFGVAAIITSNHADSETLDKLVLRIAWAVVFAFPLLVAAAYAGELFPRPRWIFQSAALLAIWAHWHFLDLENIGLTYLLVWIAAAATASTMPGLVTHPKSNWWRVNIGSLNALILAEILTLIVLIGLMLAVLSLEKLFHLELSRAYGDVMAVCGFLVSPLAVVMLLPAARADLDSKQPGFALWGRFCQWALVPIGFLFTTILAAYAIRILIKWELPDGMVAMPVLVLGCYGLAAQSILEPWRADRAWAKAFSRIFPTAFPLFSILLFMALARRIEDYGFTADRYAAFALAVWIVACCLVVLIRPSSPPVFAPAMLAAFCLIAAFGPLSSQEVCLRSQTRQLEKLLAKRSAETERRINSTLEYLVNNYDQSVVERFTGPLKLEKNSSKRDIENAARIKLGLPQIHCDHCDGSAQIKFEWPNERPIFIEGYRIVHGIRCASIPLGETSSGEKLEIWRMNNELGAYAGSKKLHTFDLSMIDPATAMSAATPPSFPWNFEGREFLILVLKAKWHKTSESHRKLTSADVIVLEK